VIAVKVGDKEETFDLCPVRREGDRDLTFLMTLHICFYRGDLTNFGAYY